MDTRLFRENDRSSLQKIYLESRKSYFTWMDSSLFKLNDFNDDTEGELIWVATQKDIPVGFVSVLESSNFIHNIFVHPLSVRQGIGSVLLNVCLRKIGRPAQLKCLVKNNNATNFYMSKGWKIISVADGPEGKYQLMQLH